MGNCCGTQSDEGKTELDTNPTKTHKVNAGTKSLTSFSEAAKIAHAAVILQKWFRGILTRQ